MAGPRGERIIATLDVGSSKVAALIAMISNPLLALADKITPRQWANENAAIYLIVASKKKTHGTL